jgi:hypothetical protein
MRAKSEFPKTETRKKAETRNPNQPGQQPDSRLSAPAYFGKGVFHLKKVNVRCPLLLATDSRRSHNK